MRKSIGEYNPGKSNIVPINSTETTTGFGSNFGHPLDMLARTAANTNSPDLDRLNTSFNGITPPAGQNIPRQPPRAGPSETFSTTWSTELTGIDPVERGWLDIDDAKWLFEKYPNGFRVLTSDSGSICFHLCR
jgi:hypothetical protein